MPKIFMAASLFVAGVFTGIIMAWAPAPEPRLDHARPLVKKPGLVNRPRLRWGAPGGVSAWRIVKDIDNGKDTEHDYVRVLALNA